jgi:hypothetical protein
LTGVWCWLEAEAGRLKGGDTRVQRDQEVNRWDIAADMDDSGPAAPQHLEKRRCQTQRRSTMAATLRVTHKAIGVEVRRGTYDVVVDGNHAGSVEMNDTIEIPIEPGRHTLQVRNGRNSSRTTTFDAADGDIVAFRCTGKSILPIFLASFVVPSLALSLVRQ